MKYKGIIAASIIGVIVLVAVSVHYVGSTYSYQPYDAKTHEIISSDKPGQTGIIDKLEPNFGTIGDEFVLPDKINYQRDMKNVSHHYAVQIYQVMFDNKEILWNKGTKEYNPKIQTKIDQLYAEMDMKLREIYDRERAELGIPKFDVQIRFLKKRIKQAKTKREAKLLDRDLKRVVGKRKKAINKNNLNIPTTTFRDACKPFLEHIDFENEAVLKKKQEMIEQYQDRIMKILATLNWKLKPSFGQTWFEYNQAVWLWRNAIIWDNQLASDSLSEEERKKIEKNLALYKHKKSWMSEKTDLSVVSNEKIMAVFNEMQAKKAEFDKRLKVFKDLKWAMDHEYKHMNKLTWGPLWLQEKRIKNKK